jgi:hypothetical protein
MKDVIPRSLSRRLILGLLGFAYVDGAWWLGHERLTEEQLDTMSAQAWSRYLRRWVNSAATN